MEKFLTVNEVCSAAGVKPSTFRRYRQQNPDMFPPAEKKGNQPLFSIETVEEVKAYRDEMIRRRAHAKTAAPDIEISGAQYRTILLHAEKISNGQADFADVLKRELRELLSVEADNLIAEPVTVESVRNFLSTIPFIVEEDNGTRYRLVGNELELIEDTFSSHVQAREDVQNGDKVSDIPPAEIDSEGVKENHSVEKEKDAAENFSFFQRTNTNVQSPQDEQATFDTPADAPSTVLENSTERSTAEQAAPVVFEDKPADVITLDERAARIRRLQADVQRGIIEIGFELIEAKKQAGHGNWEDWLQKEFEWSGRTARYFMAVAERFGNRNLGSVLKSSTLKAMLALPVGSEEEFIEAQADAGRPIETLTKSEVQKAVKEWNQRGEVGGGEYVNITGKEKNNAVVDELNHTDLGDVQAREGVPDNAPDNLHAPAEIDSEGVEDFQLTAQPPPVNNPAETVKLPPIAQNGNSTVEWYTPRQYVEAARSVLGAFDLDPASSETANLIVKAEKFYTVDNDGLNKPWRGRVWLNPPFTSGLIEQFVDKLLAEINSQNVTSAIVLCDNATETNWFCKLAARATVICFTNHRINFIRDGVQEKGSPTRGQAFLLFNGDADKFVDTFQIFGWCTKPCPVEKEKGLLFDVGEAVETC